MSVFRKKTVQDAESRARSFGAQEGRPDPAGGPIQSLPDDDIPPMPVGSRTGAPAFKPAMPADAIDPPGGADKTMHSRRATDKGKDASRQLIVGRDISLSGEITACDHLIVEGEIKAKLRGCRRIDISSAGKFNGSADIETADIGGRFDGELTVRGRLTLRSDGVVSGKLSYGEIAVEAGGRIIGEMLPLDTPATDAPDVPEKAAD